MKRTTTSRELKNKLEEYHEQLAVKQSKFDRCQDPDEQNIFRSEINLLNKNIEVLQLDIDRLVEQEQAVIERERDHKKLQWPEERKLIEELVKTYNLNYWVPEGKFIYCKNYSTDSNVVNVMFKTFEQSRIRSMLSMLSRDINGGTSKIFQSDSELICNHFIRQNWASEGTTASVSATKYSGAIYNKASIIQKYWVVPDFDNADQYNPLFDTLLYSIGGGKQENIDHLEQWIAYRYLRPERVANTPNLDLGGYPGGNGKGRYVELCKTIFTQDCVTEAKAKELSDGFNGSWEMSFVLYYDEPTSKELPEGKLKNATGSDTMIIERKGIDSYTADRNYSFLFCSNNPKGVVRLAGTGSSGEDRRWSVLITDITLVARLMQEYNCDEEQAKLLANEIARLVKDRGEVGRWLAHVIKKHDVANIELLRPLHGEDYHRRFEDQKSDLDTVFDSILPVFQRQRIINLDILVRLAQAMTENDKISSRQIKTQFSRYLTKHGITTTYKKKKLHVVHVLNSVETYTGCWWIGDETLVGNDFDWTEVSAAPYPPKNARVSREDLII